MTSTNTTSKPGLFANRRTVALVAVSGYTVLAVIVILLRGEDLPPAVRIPLALPVLLFAPGYGVVTAVFPASGWPRKQQSGDRLLSTAGSEIRFSRLERATVAVVTSLVLVPTVALGLNFVVGVNARAVLAVLAGLTVVASAVAFVRANSGTHSIARMHGDPGLKLSTVVRDRLTVLAVAVTVLLLASSVAMAFAGTPTAPNSEFYLVGGTDAAANGTDSETAARAVFELRIKHHSSQPERYTVVVLLEGSPDSSRELDRFSSRVHPDEVGAETYRPDPSAVQSGTALRFLLYRGDAPKNPDPMTAHRTLKLSINATSGQA